MKIEEDSVEKGLDPELMKYNAYFDKLYHHHPLHVNKKVSRDERDAKNFSSPTLVYGEIEFLPFAEQLLKIKNYGGMQQEGGLFVDIGCGSGKPVFGAALSHDWDRCVGIEILEGLNKVCLEVEAVWHKGIKPRLTPSKQAIAFDFYHTDATKNAELWIKADVVFMNSTCFSDNLMGQLAVHATKMKPDSFVITTTRCLPSPAFEVLLTTKMTESWGDATLIIQRRLPEKGILTSSYHLDYLTLKDDLA